MDGQDPDVNGVPAYRYVECPELTYARINARESSDQDQ